MTISAINPVDGAVLAPRDSFSFVIDDTYTALTIAVETQAGSDTVYDTTLGGAQAGYTVTVEDLGSTHRFTVVSTAGLDVSPCTVTVVENETGSEVTTTFSYILTGTQVYPTGMQPYAGTYEGSLIVTDDGVAVRTDVGWLDIVGATIVDLGNGKVKVTVTGGASGGFPGIGQWQYDVNTADTDPGAGTFRFDNATQGSVTFIYADDLDATGVDQSTTFANIRKGDLIKVQNVASQARGSLWLVTDDVTDGTGYFKIPVSRVAAGTSDIGVDSLASFVHIPAALREYVDVDGLSSAPANPGTADARVYYLNTPNEMYFVDASGNAHCMTPQWSNFSNTIFAPSDFYLDPDFFTLAGTNYGQATISLDLTALGVQQAGLGNWAYSSTTTPGGIAAGTFRLNALQTEMYVHVDSTNGLDMSNPFLSLNTWSLTFMKASADSAGGYITINSVADNGTYFTFGISSISTSGTLTNGDVYTFGVAPTGPITGELNVTNGGLLFELEGVAGADPSGATYFTANTSDITTTTSLKFSDNTFNGQADVSLFLAGIPVGSKLLLLEQPATGSGAKATTGTITSVTDGAGFTTIAFTNDAIAFSATLVAGEKYELFIMPPSASSGGGKTIGLGTWSKGADTIGATASDSFDVNNATILAITQIRILATNPLSGAPIDGIVEGLSQTGVLILQDVSNPDANSIIFNVTSHATAGAGLYWDLTGTVVEDSGTNWATSYSVQFVPGGTGAARYFMGWCGIVSTVGTTDYLGPNTADPSNPTWSTSYGAVSGDAACPNINNLFTNIAPVAGSAISWTAQGRVNGACEGVYQLWAFDWTSGSATKGATLIGQTFVWDGTQNASFVYKQSGTFAANSIGQTDFLVMLYKPSVGVSASSTVNFAITFEAA